MTDLVQSVSGVELDVPVILLVSPYVHVLRVLKRVL